MAYGKEWGPRDEAWWEVLSIKKNKMLYLVSELSPYDLSAQELSLSLDLGEVTKPLRWSLAGSLGSWELALKADYRTIVFLFSLPHPGPRAAWFRLAHPAKPCWLSRGPSVGANWSRAETSHAGRQSKPCAFMWWTSQLSVWLTEK